VEGRWLWEVGPDTGMFWLGPATGVVFGVCQASGSIAIGGDETNGR